jgi:hypothetical protein
LYSILKLIINFLLLSVLGGGPDEITEWAAYDPRAVVCRPLKNERIREYKANWYEHIRRMELGRIGIAQCIMDYKPKGIRENQEDVGKSLRRHRVPVAYLEDDNVNLTLLNLLILFGVS